jgi:hypothetical protein
LLSGTGWGSPVGPTPLPAPPCTAMAGPRCTGRRSVAIAESSDCSSHSTPTSTPRTATGAPFFAAANRRSARAESPPPSAAGTRRCSGPRSMAIPTPSRSCCCAAPTGPSRTSAGTAALRRTAEPKPQQPRARRRTPKQEAEYFGGLAAYEAGESQVHPARRLTAPAPLPTLLVPTDTPSVLAVGVRRSSGQGGDAALAL